MWEGKWEPDCAGTLTAAHNDDVCELVMRVAAEEISVEEIADLLRELRPPSRPPRTTDDPQGGQPIEASRGLGRFRAPGRRPAKSSLRS